MADSNPPKLESPIWHFVNTFESDLTPEGRRKWFAGMKEYYCKYGEAFEKVLILMIETAESLLHCDDDENVVPIMAWQRLLAALGEHPCGPLCQLWLPETYASIGVYLCSIAKCLVTPHLHADPPIRMMMRECPALELNKLTIRPDVQYRVLGFWGPEHRGGRVQTIRQTSLFRYAPERYARWCLAKLIKDEHYEFYLCPLGDQPEIKSNYGTPTYTWDMFPGTQLRPETSEGYPLSLLDFCTGIGWNLGLNSCMLGLRLGAGPAPGACGCSRRHLVWEAVTLDFLSGQGNLYKAIAELTTDPLLAKSCKNIARSCRDEGKPLEEWKGIIEKAYHTATWSAVGDFIPPRHNDGVRWMRSKGPISWYDIQDVRYMGRFGETRDTVIRARCRDFFEKTFRERDEEGRSINQFLEGVSWRHAAYGMMERMSLRVSSPKEPLLANTMVNKWAESYQYQRIVLQEELDPTSEYGKGAELEKKIAEKFGFSKEELDRYTSLQ